MKSDGASHRKKYKITYNSERHFMEDRLSSAHYSIAYDPPGDGNCQFAVLCESLRSIGLHRSVNNIREQIVEYLTTQPHMQNYTTVAWSTYLEAMARDGTYGDHLTLQAAAELYNVVFVVISSLGPAATAVISPMNSFPICTFYIGHFAEGDGEHYVGLENDPAWHDMATLSPAIRLPGSTNTLDQQPFSDSSASISEGPPDSRTSDLPVQSEIPIENNPLLSYESTSAEVRATVLNEDILEHIIQQTLTLFPYMRQALRAVSRLFRDITDKEPAPMVYIPELDDITDIRQVSVRKVMSIKGKASGAVIRLREIINHVKWASAWLSFIARGSGWYGITHIYWKNRKK